MCDELQASVPVSVGLPGASGQALSLYHRTTAGTLRVSFAGELLPLGGDSVGVTDRYCVPAPIQGIVTTLAAHFEEAGNTCGSAMIRARISRQRRGRRRTAMHGGRGRRRPRFRERARAHERVHGCERRCRRRGRRRRCARGRALLEARDGGRVRLRGVGDVRRHAACATRYGAGADVQIQSVGERVSGKRDKPREGRLDSDHDLPRPDGSAGTRPDRQVRGIRRGVRRAAATNRRWSLVSTPSRSRQTLPARRDRLSCRRQLKHRACRVAGRVGRLDGDRSRAAAAAAAGRASIDVTIGWRLGRTARRARRQDMWPRAERARGGEAS